MSIYKNGKLIAGGRQCMPLLSFMWADHVLNDASWLRADTFSWQSGSVYQAAYQHLTADITGKTLQSETISGTTIQFYLADDGHKICPASQESNVTAIYNATGVAWYYIIDTVNQRFKLPRVNPEKELLEKTLASIVSNGLQPRFTNGSATGYLRQAMKNLSGYTYYMYADGVGLSEWDSTALTFGDETGLKLDWSQSQSYYKGNKYLYFYVGNFTQTALENTAGVTTETLNEKADLDLANVLANIDFVIESQLPTAENGYTWYRKYKSGWVEQGGLWTNPSASSSNYTQTLLIEMADNKYQTSVTVYTDTPGTSYYAPKASNRTTTTFVITSNQSQVMWQVNGMAAN